MKTTDLNVRIEPALKEAVRKAAERQRRSLSSIVIEVLEDYVKRQNNKGTLKR